MHTTHQLIALAKQRLALKHHLALPMTDYRLAKLLGLKQSTVSAWRTGVRGIGTEFAAQFASTCELPEAYVFACIEHEREKNPSVLRILEMIAKQFAGKAASLALAIMAALLLAGIPEKQAFAALAPTPENIHYAHVRGRKRRRIRRIAHSSIGVDRLPSRSFNTRKTRMRTALIATACIALAGCAAVHDTIAVFKTPQTTEQIAAQQQLAMERQKQRQFERCMKITLGAFASFQAPEARLKAAEACKQP